MMKVIMVTRCLYSVLFACHLLFGFFFFLCFGALGGIASGIKIGKSGTVGSVGLNGGDVVDNTTLLRKLDPGLEVLSLSLRNLDGWMLSGLLFHIFMLSRCILPTSLRHAVLSFARNS